MGSRTVSTLLSLFLIVSARGELQLVPSVSSYELDGTKFTQLAFTDGDLRPTYAPPRGWEYAGSPNKLVLHPPNKPQAEATISTVVLPRPATFDDQSTKQIVEEALASVSRGSSNVELVSQQKNPLMIDRKETFLITLTYSLLGENYARSILVLNRGNEQVRFQLVCRQADFADLQKAFLTSQYSWQNL